MEADLAICLGTSLKITPACNLPLRTLRKYKALPDKPRECPWGKGIEPVLIDGAALSFRSL